MLLSSLQLIDITCYKFGKRFDRFPRGVGALKTLPVAATTSRNSVLFMACGMCEVRAWTLKSLGSWFRPNLDKERR